MQCLLPSELPSWTLLGAFIQHCPSPTWGESPQPYPPPACKLNVDECAWCSPLFGMGGQASFLCRYLPAQYPITEGHRIADTAPFLPTQLPRTLPTEDALCFAHFLLPFLRIPLLRSYSPWAEAMPCPASRSIVRPLQLQLSLPQS